MQEIEPGHPIPCFRCKDENHSEYQLEDDDEECVSCQGEGTIIPGAADAVDEKMIKRYVHCEWWVRLRQFKAKGLKLGKKKARDAAIKRQARQLWADFQRMSRREQGMNRTAMQMKISQFEQQPIPKFKPVSPNERMRMQFRKGK